MTKAIKHFHLKIKTKPKMPAKMNTVINETFIFNMDICIFSRHAEGQEDTILSYEPVIRQESKYSEFNIFHKVII